MSVNIEADQYLKSLYDGFQDTIQVASQMLNKYELNHLALLGDASFNERRAPVIVVSIVLQNRVEAIRDASDWRDKCEEYLEDCYKKVKTGEVEDPDTGDKKPIYKKVCKDNVLAGIWRARINDCERWISINESVRDQAKAQMALFRNISILSAFKAFEKDRHGSIFGGSEGGMASIKKKIMAAKDKVSGGKKKLSKDDEKYLKDRGVDLSAPVPEPEPHVVS